MRYSSSLAHSDSRNAVYSDARAALHVDARAGHSAVSDSRGAVPDSRGTVSDSRGVVSDSRRAVSDSRVVPDLRVDLSGIVLPRVDETCRIGEALFDAESFPRLEALLRRWPQRPRPQLVRAASDRQKEAAIALHLSKDAFSESTEAEFTRRRIEEGRLFRCVSWNLELNGEVLAACTLRYNNFARSHGTLGDRWVQVMNISSKVERRGHGTRLFELLERELRREDIFTVVLFPADNHIAPKFWDRLGFKEVGQRTGRASMLPPEDSQDFEKLIVEMDVVTGKSLHRWEKNISIAHNSLSLPVKRKFGE